MSDGLTALVKVLIFFFFGCNRRCEKRDEAKTSKQYNGVNHVFCMSDVFVCVCVCCVCRTKHAFVSIVHVMYASLRICTPNSGLPEDEE